MDRGLDAEYWRPDYVEAETQLEQQETVPLSDLSHDIRKGIFDIKADEYVEAEDDGAAGVPFLRSSNVGWIVAPERELAYISSERHSAHPTTALRRGDIVLSKTGRPAASLVLEDSANVSQDVIAVQVDRSKVDPYALCVFLASDLGRSQLERWFQGQVQAHLTVRDARTLRIPLMSDELASEVRSHVEHALDLRSQVAAQLSSAEELLRDDLGLAHGKFSSEANQPAGWSVSMSRALGEGRLDAEFFTPRYDDLRDFLANGGQSVSDVADLITERWTKPTTASDHTYIEIGDVGPNGTVEGRSLETEDMPSRAKYVVRDGDLLVSTVRPLRRRVGIVRSGQVAAIASSGFCALRGRPQDLAALFTFFRLPEIAELLHIKSTASMYPALAVKDLLAMPVAMPSQPTSELIRDAVASAHASSEESWAALSTAVSVLEAGLKS